MKKIRLGDVATYVNGYAFKPADRGDKGLPIVRIQDLTGNAYDLGFYDGDYPKRIEINNGDILISWSASLGVYIWNQGKALLNQHIFKVVFDKAEINKYYFVYAVKYNLNAMESKAHGATMKHIVKKEFDNMLIPYPSLEEQEKIAVILSKASQIIEQCQQALDKLDEIIKARFVEMFGNKGENPNEYPQDVLGNLYKFQYGKGNNIPEDKGEYPCYGSNGIVGHHVEYNSEDSPIIGHIGAYAGIVNWGVGKHYVTYNGVICKLKTNKLNPIYGFHLLQLQDFNSVATKGGGQPFVSYGDLEAPLVVVPPLAIQNQYAEFAEQIDKSKVAVQKALDEAQLLFDSLMQQYFG